MLNFTIKTISNPSFLSKLIKRNGFKPIDVFYKITYTEIFSYGFWSWSNKISLKLISIPLIISSKKITSTIININFF